MNTATLNTTETLQDEFNLSELTRAITRNKNLSGFARILGVEMLHASGRKGFNWYMIQTWADLLGRSRSQIHSYIRELVAEGIVKIHKQRRMTGRGYCNVYQVLIVPTESHDVVKMRHRKEDLSTENVNTQRQQETVFSLRPPEQPKPQTHEPPPVTQGETRNVPVELDTESTGLQSTVAPSIVISSTEPHNYCSQPKTRKKPVPHYLIREILTLTNDKKSFGLWYKFVSKCDEQTVYRCLDCLRSAIDCDQVNHRGRYLVGIMKQICPEVFQGDVTTQKPESRASINTQPSVSKPVPHAQTVTRNSELNKAGLAEIKAILFGKKTPEGTDANRLNMTRTARSFEQDNTKHAER